METIFKANFYPIERDFVSSVLMFLVLWSYFQRANLLNSLTLLSSGNIPTFELPTGESESNIHVTVTGTEIEYEVFRKYDFFIPDVDVVCQCSCTDDTLRSCSRDDECGLLANSTTTCTIYITIHTNSSFCSKFYKLCCQVYFTKTDMRPFRALYLKYLQTRVKLKIISQSGKADAYNFTLTKSGKRILVNPDKVLYIPEFSPVRHIPETWYFTEDGADELQYSDAMNGREERDLNKIGWFQYIIRENRLARVGLQDLKRHLQVKLLNCHSNPPMYEWKLNATYYVSKGLMHLPQNVKKISKMYKDISKISVDLKEQKIKVVTTNFPVTNISVSSADIYPFVFTSSIKNAFLYLTVTKGRGSFSVEITTPHWTKTVSFSTETAEQLIQLPDKHYDSCWVCVSQNNQQLCQVPALIKYDRTSIMTSTTARLNNISHVNVTKENVTDFPMNKSISSSDNLFNTAAMIVTVTVLLLVVATSLPVILILWRRRQRKLKKKDVCDEVELEPLSSNSKPRRPRTLLTNYCFWKRSSRISETMVRFSEEGTSSQEITSTAFTVNASLESTQGSEPSTVERTTPQIHTPDSKATTTSEQNASVEPTQASEPSTAERTTPQIHAPDSKATTTSEQNASVDKIVTPKEMHQISLKFSRKESRRLARILNLSSEGIREIEARCSTDQYDDEAITYEILEDWKRRSGNDATTIALAIALLDVGRKDVADKVFSNLSESVVVKEMQKQYKGIQVKIEGQQQQRYQRVELPQVNWTKRILPLEELYVTLELMKTVDEYEESRGEPMSVEELFDPVDGKQPVRILVEGGPGYGKTTLCLKLLNDFGQRRYYSCQRFKMVFLFQLRHCEESESVEEMLKRECEAVGVDGDEGIRCIEAFQSETLLLLDGFDEISEEGKRKFIPLFLKNKYPSIFVVVTSRRGMFQVEKKKTKLPGGYCESVNEDVNAMEVWGKRVLIKGVTKDKVETFLKKYLAKDYEELKRSIDPIIGGEMREVFECPLFLILLAMMLEEKKMENVDSKTTLFKEFFNFIVRRNLIREKKISEEEDVDIFDETSEHSVVHSLHQFGRLSVEYLCQNKLTFEEKDILENCKDELILKLGFLIKNTNMEGHLKNDFYQPIHKSFLEFVAAFATWRLFKTDEHEFKREMERVGEKGMKPTDDSLFHVFLGGFMNSRSHVLFQTLSVYRLWFNIESLCFTNILSEVRDFGSFFSSFQPTLDSFIPSYYNIDGAKGLTREYFQSEIHSLILKHASDRQLIHLLQWNSYFSINLSHELYVDSLFLILTNDIPTVFTNENKTKMKCKNVICFFTQSFETKKWNNFVSLLNSIQSEKVHFLFDSESSEINSLALNLLHEELIDGRWKQKNIDRLRFHLNEFDDPRSLSLLVDLVKKNRINEGVFVWIHEMERKREEKEMNLIKRETEELFTSINQSKTIQEFNIINLDSNFSPDFHFSRFTNFHLKKLYFDGSLNLLNSNENKESKYELEEVEITSWDEEKNVNWIQSIRGTKYLWCHLNCFNSLIEIEWSGLKVIEELQLFIDNTQSIHFLNSVSQLTNLQILTLNVTLMKPILSNSDQLVFIRLFSSLRLRICEFYLIQNLEIFSFFTGMVMEGMKKKEEDENNSTIDTKEGKKIYLQELVIAFNKIEIDLDELKKSDGVQRIKTKLRHQRLKQCCFVDFNDYHVIKSDEVESLFPSKEKFRIFCEVNGRNSNSSRRSQFEYRWFSWFDRFCIEYIEE